MSAASFFWQLAQEDNNIQEQEASDEENYLTDAHYEQERFTDAYMNILKLMRIKLIGSLMMSIVKSLQIS